MATDKLINHSQGESIITNLGTIATNLQNVTAISPAKFGMGYAVCDTAAGTAAKTANIANYVLTEGALVTVKFTNANTASNATLNLNNTGAKPILYKGSALTTDIISAGDMCTFIYSTANDGSYNIINVDALSGAGAGTVKSVGAEGGIITDQTSGAAISTTGSVKLNLKSNTAFTATAPDPVEIENKIYPVALDAAGHPAVSVPGTEYTQGAGINISENNEITNTGVFDVTTPTGSDTTATNGDIKVTKKVVNSGVTSESVTFVKPKGINDPAFKALDSSTSGLTSDDDHVPTSKTVQDAIDTALASASVYKGTISAFNDLPTSTATVIVRKGWYYRVSTAWAAATGTPATHVGDIIIAEIDSPSKAIDSTNWSLLHNEANTDANVTQSPVSTNANYEVLFSGSADNTAHTEGAGKDSGLTYNPSTNKLTISGEVSASSYSGLPDGNTTTKGIVQLGTDADKAASGDHGHGNITNGGALQTTDVSIASGDKLVITDASDSNKVARASISFDGSTATQALTKKGTFESFQAPISASNKLSSDFVDDTNKTHRFATADQLTQIATNQTNILYAVNTGVKNLLTITGTNESMGNVTFTHNDDGSVLVNSSSGSHSNVFHTLHEDKIYLKAGTYVLSGCPSGGSGSSYEIRLYSNAKQAFVECKGTPVEFTLSTDNWINAVLIRIDSTYNPSNMTFYPMICAKSVYDQDSSFMVGALPNYDLTRLEAEDRASLAEVVDSGAKNILDFANLQFQTQAGTTYTKTDTDITVASTGTVTWAACTYKMSLSAGNYVFSAKISNLSIGSGGVAKICLDTQSDGHGTRAATLAVEQNGTVSKPFTWGGGTLYIMYYPNYSGNLVVTTFKASENMICTKAAFGVSNKFVPFGNDPFYQVPINHNMIYRGRNLGATLTDAQHTALSSGNFNDLYLGDYWTKTVTIPAGTYTGGDGEEVTVPAQTNITLKAVIADFDTFYAGYASSYTAINTHHAAVIVTGFGNVVWNGSNNTTGGYVNSLIHKWLVGSALPQIETWFGSAKVLSHQKLLTNAITGDAASGWAWSSQKISLLSENQMYGSKVWGNSKAANGGYEPGEAFKHLNVLNHIDANLLFGNKNIWLRDIASAERAAGLSDGGHANNIAASTTWIAPVALILLS